jgi:hypothetical protein
MKIFSVVMLLLFSGCAYSAKLTEEQINNLDYGKELNIDYKQAIKSYFDKSLFDPYSAVYEYEEPKKFYVKESILEGSKIVSGYGVAVNLNAKNQMGGYTGIKQYVFVFKNNEIVRVIYPEEVQIMKMYGRL